LQKRGPSRGRRLSHPAQRLPPRGRKPAAHVPAGLFPRGRRPRDCLGIVVAVVVAVVAVGRRAALRKWYYEWAHPAPPQQPLERRRGQPLQHAVAALAVLAGN
jgi:hypothetical protein